MCFLTTGPQEWCCPGCRLDFFVCLPQLSWRTCHRLKSVSGLYIISILLFDPWWCQKTLAVTTANKLLNPIVPPFNSKHSIKQNQWCLPPPSVKESHWDSKGFSPNWKELWRKQTVIYLEHILNWRFWDWGHGMKARGFACTMVDLAELPSERNGAILWG